MARELRKTIVRTVVPIAIGAAVCAWMFHDEFNMSTLREITFDSHIVAAIILAMIFVIGRDFGLAWRFHTIADGDLTWKRSFRVDIMCAFTSAITPSVVGGSALAIFYLNREGFSLGRATTLTLTTLFLDELFFVVFCPVVVLLLPTSELFDSMTAESTQAMFLSGIRFVFWLVYAGIVIWTTILYFAIIGRPDTMQRILRSVAGIKLLRRWRKGILSTAGNMVSTSAWVKGRGPRWWANVFGATVLSWFSRYFVVNALFWGFVPTASGLLVFGRQFIVWVVLMVSPTPGGSGISEWLFTNYYGDLIGNVSIALMLALIWRLMSYYIYLAAGSCLLPGYFREKKL